MRKHEREQRRRGWRENGEPLDNKMISPLVSKVKTKRGKCSKLHSLWCIKG
jgi:hypothetical protein